MDKILSIGNKEIEQYCLVKHDKNNNQFMLERDFLGIVPLFYKEEKNTLKVSIKKIPGFIELKPNTKAIIIPNKSKQLIRRNNRLTLKNNNDSKTKIISKTSSLLDKAIDKRLKLIFKQNKNAKIGLLFSGGIDSTYLAYKLKTKGINFTCYNSSVDFNKKEIKESEDFVWSKKAKKLNFNIKYIRATEKEIEKAIPQIAKIINSSNHIKISIALPFYFAIKQAKKDKITHLFTGLGSEEIFAGYERHSQSKNINQECINGLEKLSERDLYRDFSLLNHFGIKTVLPFLDFDLINYAIDIPSKLKIRENIKKYIFRLIAEKEGIPREFAFRKKRAAQYGSNFDKAIQKLTKSNGFKYKQDYIDYLIKTK